MKKCPKCDFERHEDELECMKCGIIFKKYEKREKEKIQPANFIKKNKKPKNRPNDSDDSLIDDIIDLFF